MSLYSLSMLCKGVDPSPEVPVDRQGSQNEQHYDHELPDCFRHYERWPCNDWPFDLVSILSVIVLPFEQESPRLETTLFIAMIETGVECIVNFWIAG